MYSNRKRGQQAPLELHLEHIEELHYITKISNLTSILKHGLLSHKRARRTLPSHGDVSNSEVQNRRAKVMVPRTNTDKPDLALHRHVNLYLNSSNAMMYNIINAQHVDPDDLCILRIRREVFERGDGKLSSENASTEATVFFNATQEGRLYSPRSSQVLCAERISGYDELKKRQIRQAEALFPYQVKPEFIGDIFVASETSKAEVVSILKSQNNTTITVTIKSDHFLQDLPYPYAPPAPHSPLPPLSPSSKAALPFDLPESSSDEAEVSASESDYELGI